MPEIATSVKDLFLNPRTYDPSQFDTETARLLRATIDYFEGVGKTELLRRDHDAVWVTDYLDFVKREKLFSTFLTGADYADGDENRRWDTSRNAALSEILGFYGLAYWYAEQVTILGLGPIWMSGNEEAKRKAAAQLADGGVMAFGLSERAHGADVYSTDMLLTPDGEGGFTADGTKYYIGNGNVAGMVSVFGRRTDIDGPEGYVFFVADSSRPDYRLIDNVTHGQMYVSTFALEKYTVTEADILHTGPEAFAAALNTVNIGKFNLCSGSVGMVEHSFYESITHAHNRILYGHPVTDFSHVRGNFVEAFARIAAMKLFSTRAVDYFRSASLDDRRYLLFNPMTKSKVTSEGEKVMTLLLDVVAAKGYEKSTYFHQANHYIGWLPRLEGTVHVNVSQILKFMPNYFFNPRPIPRDRYPGRRRRRLVLLGTGTGRRHRHDSIRRLDQAVRGVRQPAERRGVLRAGQGTQGPPEHRRAVGRPAEGPRLPADHRASVLVGRLRSAHPRTGQDSRSRSRSDRPDLRRLGAGFLRIRGDTARCDGGHGGAAAVGARGDPRPACRRQPLRSGVGHGRLVRRCLRDARLIPGALIRWVAGAGLRPPQPELVSSRARPG
jgi:acyl-CoA dehydrogenase